MHRTEDEIRALLVIGHGRDQGLGHALLETVREALEERSIPVRVHDLLADGFDPVLRLATGQAHPGRVSAGEDPIAHGYQEDATWANLFVFVHPVWWFAPPAILKGWIDRIFVDGVAVKQIEGGTPEGLLHGKRALVVQTFNTNRMVDRVVFSNITGTFWRKAVCLATGLKLLQRVPIYGAAKLDETSVAAHQKHLRKVLSHQIKG
ncbi:MAG: NAD(P)H-dependent oxidoreductase [Planctomycetota bacterium]